MMEELKTTERKIQRKILGTVKHRTEKGRNNELYSHIEKITHEIIK